MSDTSSELTSPMTTADIAANVVEQADTPVETPNESGAVDSGYSHSESAAAPAPAAHEAPPSKAELLLRKNGFKHQTKPDGREHWLQRSRVSKMLEEAFSQAEGEWTPKRSELEQQIQEYRSRVEGWTPLAQALDDGPEAFLAFVTQRDPRYTALQRPAEPQKPAAMFSMPEPDVPLPDGSRTYSVQGIQKALESAMVAGREQASAAAREAAMEALKPITEKEERAKLESVASERRQSAIAEANTWPGFKEHLKDIEAAMAEDSAQAQVSGKFKIKGLHDAYIKVVVPKLAQGSAATREQLLKEMQQAPTSTSIPRNGGEVPRPSKPRSIEEIAREVVTKAG